MDVTYVCKVCGKQVSDSRHDRCRSCAAIDRWRVYRASKQDSPNIPQEITEILVKDFGQQNTQELTNMATRLFAKEDITRVPVDEKTYGNTYNNDMYGLINNVNYSSYAGAISFEKINNMMRCGQVMFGLAIKKAPISTVFKNKLSLTVKSNKSDDSESDTEDEFVKEVDRNLKDVLQKAINDLLTCLEYGVSINEVVWKVEDGLPLIDKINSVDPKTVDKLYLDKQGKFDGFSQLPPNGIVSDNAEGIRVPVEQSLLITYNKKFRNLWGESILVPVYPFFFWYDIVWRSFVRYLEKCGSPPVVATAPSNQRIKTKGGAAMDALDAAEQLAFKVSRSPAVAIPSDTNADGKPLWTIEYLKSDSKGDQFVQALELLGKMIIRSILVADTVGTQQESGSYNLGSIHAAITMLDNERILSEILQQINKYLLPKYVEFKYGVNSGIELYVETVGLNESEKVKLFEILRSGIQNKVPTTDQIDYEEICESIGIPTISREEMLDMKQEQVDIDQENQISQQEKQAEVQKKYAPETPPAAKGGPQTEKSKPPFAKASIEGTGLVLSEYEKEQLV